MSSNWHLDLYFSRNSILYWKEHFKNLFSKSLYDITDRDKDLQLQKSGWDFQLNFTGYRQPLRVECKSRRMSYYQQFKNDKLILLELKGNIKNNINGSSILNSNSDLFAYGFFDDKEKNLHSPMVFYTQSLKDFVVNNPKPAKKGITKGTQVGSESYQTLFRLDKLSLLNECIFDPNYEYVKQSNGQSKLFLL